MKAENFIANNYHSKAGLEADKLIEDNTGIVVSFEEIAESYHQAKLKLLGISDVSLSLSNAGNYDYLRGFIDGYGGDEPHGIMPDGFNNINEVWDRMYELKGNEKELYTREDVENFGLWLGQLPKKQKFKMIDLLFDDWINI